MNSNNLVESYNVFKKYPSTLNITIHKTKLLAQLNIGGKMVVPIGKQSEVQHLWVIKKDIDGSLSKEKVLPVGFVPMVKKNN